MADWPPISDPSTCSNRVGFLRGFVFILNYATVAGLMRQWVQPISMMVSMSPWVPVLGTVNLTFIRKGQMASLTIRSSSSLFSLCIIGRSEPRVPSSLLASERGTSAAWQTNFPFSAGFLGSLFGLAGLGALTCGTGAGTKHSKDRWPSGPHRKHLMGLVAVTLGCSSI